MEVKIADLSTILALNTLITDNLTAMEISDYLEWHLILSAVDSLNGRYLTVHQEFRMAMEGVGRAPSLREACGRVVASRLPRLLDRLYVERHFDGGIVPPVNEVYQNVAKAFGRMLRDSDWMDEGTKVGKWGVGALEQAQHTFFIHSQYLAAALPRRKRILFMHFIASSVADSAV